jgi:hypothetical protein
LIESPKTTSGYLQQFDSHQPSVVYHRKQKDQRVRFTASEDVPADALAAWESHRHVGKMRTPRRRVSPFLQWRMVSQCVREVGSMPKIDIEAAPSRLGSTYPPPLDELCNRMRRWKLGASAGLTQLTTTWASSPSDQRQEGEAVGGGGAGPGRIRRSVRELAPALSDCIGRNPH